MDLKGLPSELEQFVEQEISEGTYQSAEEVVSTALRLLQAHKAKGDHASLSPNGQSRTVPRSAEEVVQAIRNALATGHYDAAHQLAREGAKHYLQHEALQQYAHVLAPPAVRNVPSSSDSRAAVKANGEWLKPTAKIISVVGWRFARGNWCASMITMRSWWRTWTPQNSCSQR